MLVFQNFRGGAIGPFALVATPMILARFACGACITNMALSLKIKPFVSFLVTYLSRNKHVSQAMRTDFPCAHIYYTLLKLAHTEKTNHAKHLSTLFFDNSVKLFGINFEIRKIFLGVCLKVYTVAAGL